MNFESFTDFWPFYLREHRNPTNRRFHFIGTLGSLIFVMLGLVVSPWLFFGFPIWGYGWAWVGHFFVEHNRPATFRAPFFSLMGDFKMFGLMLTRRLDKELDKHLL